MFCPKQGIYELLNVWATYFRAFNDWASVLIEFKRPMLNMIFKRNLNRFLGNPSQVSFMYVFLTKFLIFMLLTFNISL